MKLSVPNTLTDSGIVSVACGRSQRAGVTEDGKLIFWEVSTTRTSFGQHGRVIEPSMHVCTLILIRTYPGHTFYFYLCCHWFCSLSWCLVPWQQLSSVWPRAGGRGGRGVVLWCWSHGWSGDSRPPLSRKWPVVTCSLPVSQVCRAWLSTSTTGNPGNVWEDPCCKYHLASSIWWPSDLLHMMTVTYVCICACKNRNRIRNVPLLPLVQTRVFWWHLAVGSMVVWVTGTLTMYRRCVLTYCVRCCTMPFNFIVWSMWCSQ